MKVALDTNILAYAEGVDGAGRRDAVLEVIGQLPQADVVIPVQALGELFNVLVRKAGKPRVHARQAILSWQDSFAVTETSPEVLMAAADIATDHQLGIWDAIILSSASQAGCRLLLTEDLQDGFVWGGTTVVNPFARPIHPLLDALLRD